MIPPDANNPPGDTSGPSESPPSQGDLPAPPPSPPAPAQPPPAEPPRAPVNPLAVASIVVAAFALITSCCAGSFGLVGLGATAAALGFIARSMCLKEGPGSQNVLMANIGMGIGIGEFVLGMLWLCAVFGIFSTSIFGALLQSR